MTELTPPFESEPAPGLEKASDPDGFFRADDEDAYTALAEEAGLTWSRRGIWASCGRAVGSQGWKLHVSVTPQDGPKLFRLLFPLLARGNTAFKFIATPSLLRTLNEAGFGETQVGKAVTIYPENDDRAAALAAELVPLTAGLRGPEVITDLALGGTVHSRFGSYNPIMTRNRLGQIVEQIRFPDGSLRTDQYEAPYRVPEGLEHPFSGLVPDTGTDELSLSGGSELLGPGYLLLNVLRVNAKGSIFLALDLRRQEAVRYCIVKEGRKHTSSDPNGRDMRDRLKHQWKVQNAVRDLKSVPTVDDYFETDKGHGYLPMDFVEGYDFETTFGTYPCNVWSDEEKRDRLLFFARLCEAVADLHAQGIVHRDLTPRNVRITSSGTIALLDFELSWSPGDEGVPFTQGTPGFVSPQQLRNERPDPADDVYSIGSLLIWSLGNVDPQYLVADDAADLERRLRKLVPARPELCRLIADCWAERPGDRPALSDLKAFLESEAQSLSAPGKAVRSEVARAPRRDFLTQAFHGLFEAVPRSDETGLWLSHLDEKPRRDGRAQHQNGGQLGNLRSLYRGVAGPVYVCAKFADPSWLTPSRRDMLVRAIDWLLAHYRTRDDQLPGLYFGEAGVALAISHAVNSGLVSGGAWFSGYLEEALSGPLDWPDLTHGAAGQGLAALACEAVAGPVIDFRPSLRRAAQYLLDAQREDGGWDMPDGVPGMTGKQYTGFAHGVAGILAFLVRYDHRCPDAAVNAAWRRGFAWLDRLAAHNGDNGLVWPIASDEETRWFRWCHGSPGIAMAYLDAYEATRENHFKEKAIAALSHFGEYVRLTNYSTCCGLTGLGEIHLSAWQILEREEDLRKALRIGETLAALSRLRGEDSRVWQVDDAPHATADLMCGSGGVCHFLARLAAVPEARPGFPGLS